MPPQTSTINSPIRCAMLHAQLIRTLMLPLISALDVTTPVTVALILVYHRAPLVTPRHPTEISQLGNAFAFRDTMIQVWPFVLLAFIHVRRVTDQLTPLAGLAH